MEIKQVKQTKMCVRATGSREGTSLPLRCTLKPRGTLLKRLVVLWVRVCVFEVRSCIMSMNVPTKGEIWGWVCMCVFWGSEKFFVVFLFPSSRSSPHLSFYILGQRSFCHLVLLHAHQPLTNTLTHTHTLCCTSDNNTRCLGRLKIWIQISNEILPMPGLGVHPKRKTLMIFSTFAWKKSNHFNASASHFTRNTEWKASQLLHHSSRRSRWIQRTG